VSTRWSSAGTPGAPSDPLPSDPSWAGGSLYVDARISVVRASPAALWRVIEGIGGEAGWYSGEERGRCGGGFPPVSRGCWVVMLGESADSPHRELRSGSSRALRAEVGDMLITGAGGLAGIPPRRDRRGDWPRRIASVPGALAGWEYESVIFPGPGARAGKGHWA
jgi:hypothetical protein